MLCDSAVADRRGMRSGSPLRNLIAREIRRRGPSTPAGGRRDETQAEGVPALSGGKSRCLSTKRQCRIDSKSLLT
jgi:hypothetical protein